MDTTLEKQNRYFKNDYITETETRSTALKVGSGAEATYIRSDQVDSQFLAGMWEALEPTPNYLTKFIDLNECQSDEIRVKTISFNTDQAAGIQGYNDTPKVVQGGKEKSETYRPFHLRNSVVEREDPRGTAFYAVDSAKGLYMVSKALLHSHVAYLENLRMNALMEAVLSMISLKKFEYVDVGKSIVIPYYDYIDDITVASTGDFQSQLNKAALIYEKSSHLPLTHILVNYTTWDKILAKIKVDFKTWGGRTNIYDSMEDLGRAHGFRLGRYQFIVDDSIREVEGQAVPWIPDDVAIFLSEGNTNMPRPILLNRAAVMSNQFTTTGPFFTHGAVTKNPWNIQTTMYDNMIPSISTENAIMHFKIT